jgi:hypothetical protein
MMLSTHESQFLEAAAELTLRQHELEPLVAAVIGRRAYDYWILGHGRNDPALGALDLAKGGEWRFHFHGLEFDVLHIADGRSVRVDFGPGGILTFTPVALGPLSSQLDRRGAHFRSSEPSSADPSDTTTPSVPRSPMR